jgi:L-ascorbate metabolism protein UlaG (beta-lactamase superfamily)
VARPLDLIGRAYGPFDAAFLPINGAVTKGDAPHVDVARTLTPAQAAAAAAQLRARTLVPIHYGHTSADYREHPDALAQVREASTANGVALRVVEEGAWVPLP